MNSENVESSTTPVLNNSKTSSSDANLSYQKSEVEQLDLESPTAALCPKPKHLMTEDELREDTVRFRNLRDNRVMFTQVARGEREAPKPKMFEEFL